MKYFKCEKKDFQSLIILKVVETQSKYMGLSSYVGKSEQQVFDFAQD